jgi:zinc protease
MLSRMFKEVREDRGLAYHVGSALLPLRQQGPFMIALQTKNTQQAEAVTLVQTVLQRFITEGPSAEEINEAKKYLIGSFPLGVSSNEQISKMIAMLAFYDIPMDFVTQYRENIAKVTQEAVKTAFQKRVNMANGVLVTVGGELK